MTTIARRIAATPVRTSAETWAFVVDLIAAADDDMRRILEDAGNAASMLIGEEHTSADPIVLSGCGPQVRIYTLHGSTAIDGTNANEAALTITPTSDWELSLPATGPDYDLAAAAVAAIDHVDVYHPTDTGTHSAAVSTKTRAPVDIDLTVLED